MGINVDLRRSPNILNSIYLTKTTNVLGDLLFNLTTALSYFLANPRRDWLLLSVSCWLEREAFHSGVTLKYVRPLLLG